MPGFGDNNTTYRQPLGAGGVFTGQPLSGSGSRDAKRLRASIYIYHRGWVVIKIWDDAGNLVEERFICTSYIDAKYVPKMVVTVVCGDQVFVFSEDDYAEIELIDLSSKMYVECELVRSPPIVRGW